MFTITTSSKHCTRGFNQYNKARKINKKHTDWKEVKKKKKMFLFIQNHLIIYLENSMEGEKDLALLKATRPINKTNFISAY